MFHLRGEKLDGERQPAGGEDFFVDVSEDFLRRHVGVQTLAHGAEEVSLFDVLFPFQR